MRVTTFSRQRTEAFALSFPAFSSASCSRWLTILLRRDVSRRLTPDDWIEPCDKRITATGAFLHIASLKRPRSSIALQPAFYPGFLMCNDQKNVCCMPPFLPSLPYSPIVYIPMFISFHCPCPVHVIKLPTYRVLRLTQPPNFRWTGNEKFLT